MRRLVWFAGLAGVLGSGCSSEEDHVGSGDAGGTGVATGEADDDTGVPGETDVDPSAGDAGGSADETGDDEEEAETSSEPTFCDDLDACSPCRACAIEADCAAQHGACATDDDCTQLVECLEACQADNAGDVCEDACFASNPGGQALVLALHQCLVMACPNSCG